MKRYVIEREAIEDVRRETSVVSRQVFLELFVEKESLPCSDSKWSNSSGRLCYHLGAKYENNVV